MNKLQQFGKQTNVIFQQFTPLSITVIFLGILLICLPNNKLISQAACGNQILYGWGANDFGQVGDGTTNLGRSPILIGSANDWQQVSAGDYFNLFIKTDGSLWSWGFNNGGQLGDGTVIDRPTPVRVGLDNDWKYVKGGHDVSFGIKNNGTLWAWGYRNTGLPLYGTPNGLSSVYLNPTQVGTQADWKEVDARWDHALALKTNGTLWGWGGSGSGQLGNNLPSSTSTPFQIDASTDWKQATTGHDFSVAIKTDGTLWSWGFNQYGQLGNGTVSVSPAPVPTQIGTSNDWKQVTAYHDHTVALKNDGTLWAWGYNGFGELGDGTTTDRHSPVQVGSSTNWKQVGVGRFQTLAIRTDGTLWAWGNDHLGQLGDFAGPNTIRTTPIQITSNTDWTQVYEGEGHTLGIRCVCTPPTVTISGATSICSGGTTTLTATGGGSYLWNTGATTASISVSPLLSATYSVTATIATDCSNTASQLVTVNTLPTVSITGLNANYCKNATAVTLVGTPTGGSFMIDATAATTLDPSVLSVGNHTVTYSFTDVNGCSNTATQTVTINALPTVSITGLNANYCKNATAVTLVGTPTGGSFMIDGTTATTLDPSVLSIGNHTVTYSFTDVNGCSNTATQTVTINALPTVSITGLNANYCKNATAVTLVGTPTGGSFMIDGTAATTLAPSVLSVGNHTVTYSFTDVNGCSNTASQSVTINANCGADSDCDGVVDALDICPGGDDKIDNNHDGKPDCRYFVQINQLINAWKCGNNGNKVVICHIPSGNPKNRQTLCVDVSALAAHLGHGDYIGSCNNATCTPNSVDNFVLEGHAQAAIDHTLIGWTSNLGSKIDYFVIQKQNVQNTDFETLATVNNTHFSDDFQHTTFSDMQPTEGDNIYRIKTILNGGLEKYSALMKVKFSNPAYAQISPNPSDGLVDILLNTPVGLSVMIKVYNAFGHEIQEIKSTERLIHLDLSDFTSGLYLLRISQNGKRDFTKQIVIQK